MLSSTLSDWSGKEKGWGAWGLPWFILGWGSKKREGGGGRRVKEEGRVQECLNKILLFISYLIIFTSWNFCCISKFVMNSQEKEDFPWFSCGKLLKVHMSCFLQWIHRSLHLCQLLSIVNLLSWSCSPILLLYMCFILLYVLGSTIT